MISFEYFDKSMRTIWDGTKKGYAKYDDFSDEDKQRLFVIVRSKIENRTN